MPISIVTGGAGFIGSHVVDLLVEKGHDVIILDNMSSGNKDNINPNSKYYEIDIRSSQIADIFKKNKPDFVFHLAAQIDVRFSVNNPILDSETNILGSLNLLENSINNKIKKFIFSSTGGAIYGDTEIIPTNEDFPQKPISPYGINKLAVEKYLFYYHSIYKLDYNVLRLSNVYGPRQNSKGEAGVIAIFIDKLLKKEQPIINGSGNQTRDYVFVEDVAKAFLLSQESNFCGEYNIGTGIETSVNKLHEVIVNKLRIKSSIIYGPAKNGEQRRSCLDPQKAEKQLDWHAEYNLDRGIQETVKWFQNQKAHK